MIEVLVLEYAEANDHVYLDYYGSLVNDEGGMIEQYTTDGVHVSQAGYAIMAPLAETAIDEALNGTRSNSRGFTFRPIGGCTRTSSRRRNPRCD